MSALTMHAKWDRRLTLKILAKQCHLLERELTRSRTILPGIAMRCSLLNTRRAHLEPASARVSGVKVVASGNSGTAGRPGFRRANINIDCYRLAQPF